MSLWAFSYDFYKTLVEKNFAVTLSWTNFPRYTRALLHSPFHFPRVLNFHCISTDWLTWYLLSWMNRLKYSASSSWEDFSTIHRLYFQRKNEQIDSLGRNHSRLQRGWRDGSFRKSNQIFRPQIISKVSHPRWGAISMLRKCANFMWLCKLFRWWLKLHTSA